MPSSRELRNGRGNGAVMFGVVVWLWATTAGVSGLPVGIIHEALGSDTNGRAPQLALDKKDSSYFAISTDSVVVCLRCAMMDNSHCAWYWVCLPGGRSWRGPPGFPRTLLDSHRPRTESDRTDSCRPFCGRRKPLRVWCGCGAGVVRRHAVRWNIVFPLVDVTRLDSTSS